MTQLSQPAKAHLAWIEKVSPHYNFGGNWRGGSYYETMYYLYSTQPQIDADAQRWFDHDTYDYERTQMLVRSTVLRAQTVAQSDEDITPLFITLGFNHQTWTIGKCLKVIQSIRDFGWVQSCRAVFELHRENGLHPHCHIFIQPAVRYSKSKILEKLWRTKGMQGVVLQKAFIDYKEAMPYHIEYIMLRKQESKMKHVHKDNEWRTLNNIPIVEKEWVHV